jgi:hypothetical protein
VRDADKQVHVGAEQLSGSADVLFSQIADNGWKQMRDCFELSIRIGRLKV